MSPHLVFAGQSDDPLADAFTDGLVACGIRVSRVPMDIRGLSDAATSERFVGGFSRGARLSVGVAEQIPVRGLILLGYPFHPKGEPSELSMLARLRAVSVPSLVIQGERDVHGNRQRIGEVGGLVTMSWVHDGNHRFVPRQSSGLDASELLAEAVTAALGFMRRVSAP